MRFVTLGSTGEIGASCHLVEAAGVGVMLDAGVHPENDGPAGLPQFDLIRNGANRFVDHVVVTHAHHDHIGALPVLIREFPHVRVHMTRPTRDLAEFVLPASARLQRRRLREGGSNTDPLFSEEELEMQSYLHLTQELNTPFPLRGVRDGGVVEATLYHAGHILGAAGVELRFSENGHVRTAFYTGDTNLRPQSILPGGEYPRDPVDVLILESTLGADPDAEGTTRRREEQEFGRALRRVWDREGTSLIPVFAVGRAQEVLALIHRFKQRGVLPHSVPVYTAGSLRAVSELYDKTRFLSPRMNTDFLVEEVEQERLPRSRAAKERVLSEPGIHVVSSGMMFERTVSNGIAQRIVEEENSAILLVGFAQEDSPAGRLLAAVGDAGDAEPEVVLDRARGPQPVRCEVQRFRLSGHSHRRDLIGLVERLLPKKVVLVHGESQAREWMADNISFFYPDVDVILPETGVPIDL